MASNDAQPYPVRFDVDYPESLDRFSSILRIVFVIPIGVVLALLTGSRGGGYGGGAGLVFLPILLLIVVRYKYPRWWFDWNLELLRFTNRVLAYALLLTDRYPSTDEEQSVHLRIEYPDAERDLHRWLPLVKFWLLALPHYVVLLFLLIAMVVVVVIAWFAILFTGRYPRGLFDFVVGVLRWSNRVGAYAFLLTTDRYPPFRLSE